MAVLVAPAGGERPLFALTEAGRQIQIAIARREADETEPSSQIRAARRLVFSGELDEARPLLEQVVAADPGNAEAWDELEQILRFQGNAEGLVALWRARLPAEPNRGARAPSIQDLSRSVQRSGMEGYWRWRLADLEARQRGDLPVSPVDVARAHAALGNADRALTLLEQGAEAGDPRLRSVRSDPVWDFLRRDPRYIALLSDTPGSGPGGGRGEPQGQGRGGPGGRSGGAGQGGESGRSGGPRGANTAPVPPPPG
jgi:tetratricopeptide (TPR) repeat protein